MRFSFRRTFATRSWPVFATALSLVAVACGGAGEDVSSATSGGVVLTGSGGGTSTGGGGANSTSTSSGGDGGSMPQKLGPPYPIVLAHGFFGFNDFAGLGFETYFFNVKDDLAKQGETMVYTPAVDPFNSSDFRGDQLIEYIEEILKTTGHAKVNIIGHSQGGLDARAVAHKRPDLVASVITVATPHYGSKVADVVLDLVSDPLAQDALNEILKLIGAPLYDQIGNETDVFKPLYLFSQEGIAAFNASHPDAPGVFYASVTGRTAKSMGGADCTPDVPQSFVTPWNGTADPTDPLLSVSETLLHDGFNKIPNDGLVRVKDAKWGIFWGCIPADHLDEVGQLLGDGPGSGNQWDYLKFYADLVARVRAQNL